MHVTIVAPALSACMLHFDLVFKLIPYILQHFSENVFTFVYIPLTTC